MLITVMTGHTSIELIEMESCIYEIIRIIYMSNIVNTNNSLNGWCLIMS